MKSRVFALLHSSFPPLELILVCCKTPDRFLTLLPAYFNPVDASPKVGPLGREIHFPTFDMTIPNFLKLSFTSCMVLVA
jgi:hypothetical protein